MENHNFVIFCDQHFDNGLGEANYPHDDVIKWKHFSCYGPFVLGIHWSPVNSPHKGQ